MKIYTITYRLNGRTSGIRLKSESFKEAIASLTYYQPDLNVEILDVKEEWVA